MKKGETNANPKMQLLWEYPNHKRGLGIPTLPNKTEVLCTMPQMQAHKQLPHTLMASTRHNRQTRKRNQQTIKKMVKKL